MESGLFERIVLKIPVEFTEESFAAFCKRIRKPLPEGLGELLPLINSRAEPGAVLRRAAVTPLGEGETALGDTSYRSRLVADKLSRTPYVFLYAATAGEGLEKPGGLPKGPVLDTVDLALIFLAEDYLAGYLKERFGYDGSSSLNPGSLPDWPVGFNRDIFRMLGGAREIGVSADENGYLLPLNSTSGIRFPGNGYHNCSLCKRQGCVGRRAKFDPEEYARIFGTNL